MKVCPECKLTYPTDFSVCPRDGVRLMEAGAWSEGTVVRGKYQILHKIGQGGMGAVYKAQHVRFQETRALKVMSAELANDSTFVKRFFNEAVITRKLQHPNAVRVEDVDEAEDGRPFIVMEYLDGFSLKQWMRNSGPLPVERALSIIRQAAGALQAAHSLGMVHRDIKPDNLFIISQPEGILVKVLDFGIAKIKEASLGSAAAMTLTKTGIVVGTPQYMSPQQALGLRGDELDGRSDLYSLGVVMYEMLSGDPPFHADTTMKILMAHIHQPPPPIREAHPEIAIPDVVATLVMRLLEKRPEDRPGSAGELIREIDVALKVMATPLTATQVVAPRDILSATTEGAAKSAQGPRPPVVLPVVPERRVPAKDENLKVAIDKEAPHRQDVKRDISEVNQPKPVPRVKAPVVVPQGQIGAMDTIVAGTLWGCLVSVVYWPSMFSFYTHKIANAYFSQYYLRDSLGPSAFTAIFYYAWTGALAGSLIGLMVRKRRSRLGAMAWGLGIALFFVLVFTAEFAANRIGFWDTSGGEWRFSVRLAWLNLLPYGILGMVIAFLAQKYGNRTLQPVLSGRARGTIPGILWGGGLSILTWPLAVLLWQGFPAEAFWSFMQYMTGSLHVCLCTWLTATVGALVGGLIGLLAQKSQSWKKALALGLCVAIVSIPLFILPTAFYGFDASPDEYFRMILRNLPWSFFLYGGIGAFIGFITRNRKLSYPVSAPPA